jgi:hypothetical protein
VSDQADSERKPIPPERWSVEDPSDYDYLDRPPTYYEGEKPPDPPAPIDTPRSD